MVLLLLLSFLPIYIELNHCVCQVLEATKALVQGHRRRRLEQVNIAECQLLTERWASTDCQSAMRQYIDSVNDSL